MPVSITVDGTPRSYTEAYSAKYRRELAAGNTKIYASDLVTGEPTILRVSHDERKDIERHYVSLEDHVVNSSGVSQRVRVGITLEFPDDQQALACDIAEGLMASLTADTSAILNSIAAGALSIG
jgi:hypothetical protein